MFIDAISAMWVASLVGYGEVVNQQPNWGQREMHTVTNLVRVDPMAWAADYDCSTNEFTTTERSPKAPLYHHGGLNEIAQRHSEDQAQWGNMAHESSDGTPFGDRTWPYYEGNTIGENVAWNYADNWEVVIEGWMCSAGHRQNIMAADFEHLGTGLENRYYTQDFGGGAALPNTPVAMGVHTPERPRSAVEFWATWDDARAPGSLNVETDTECSAMELFVGTDTQGGWHLEADAESGCTAYRFRYELQNGAMGFFPETGSYQYGDSCPLWTADEPVGCNPPEPEPDPDDDDDDDTIPSDPDDDNETGGIPNTGGGEDCGEVDFIDRNGDCLPDDDHSGTAEGKFAMGCSSTPSAPSNAWFVLLGLTALAGQRRRA